MGDEAVDHSHQGSTGEHEQNREAERPVLAHQVGSHQIGAADQRRHRKVDTADQDHQRLAGGGDPQERGEDERRVQRALAEEAADRGAGDDQQHDHGEDLEDRNRAQQAPRERLLGRIAPSRRFGAHRRTGPVIPRLNGHVAAPRPDQARSEQHRKEQHAAVGDLDEVSRGVQVGQEVVEQEDARRADRRQEQTAPAAGQVSAAERDGGQRDQDVVGEHLRVGRAHEPRQRDAADPGHHSAEGVGGDPDSVDIHPGRERGGVVVAD